MNKLVNIEHQKNKGPSLLPEEFTSNHTEIFSSHISPIILLYFDYSAVFHHAAKLSLTQEIANLQNRAIQVIFKLPPCTNVDRNHIELGLWHMENRCLYFVLNLMYQFMARPNSICTDILRFTN